MSARAQPHWRLDARVGWRGLSPDANVETGAALELGVAPGEAQPLIDGTGSFGGFAEATGIAVDERGDVYVLDRRACRIVRFDACTRRFERIDCVGGRGAGPRSLSEPTSLAIGPRGDVVVVDYGNRRLQVFTRKGWALRRIVGPFEWLEGHLRPSANLSAPSTWRPHDVAIAPDGTMFISDRNGRVHVLDARGAHAASIDGAQGGGDALVDPTHIALDCRGTLYVIDGDRVRRFDVSGGAAGAKPLADLEAPAELAGRFCPVAVAVDPDGNVYVTEHVTGRLMIASGAEPRLRPSLAYTGLGLALAFDSSGNPLVGDARVTRLSAAARRATQGRFVAGPLDGRREACRWHRIVLEGEVPAGTRVDVHAYTADVDLVEPEPDASEWWECGARRAEESGEEWDCLVHAPPGRYLWLRLSFVGDGERTPSIRAVRVEYPRVTGAEILPAVFRRDPTSWDFTERLLAIFDSVRRRDDELLSELTRFFGADSARADANDPRRDFLAWLSSWLGVVADGDFSEAQRRALLRQAPELYRWRGTARGLRAHVRAYTGLEPTVLEHFRVRRWAFLGSSRLGDATELWGTDVLEALQLGAHSRIGEFLLADRGDPRTDPLHVFAHRFTVFAPSPRPLSPSQRATLERVVQEAKPAHTVATVVTIGPRMQIGRQSRVGVDTIVGAYPSGVTAGEARLGRSSVLSPSPEESDPPSLRIGSRSRIGAHTRID